MTSVAIIGAGISGLAASHTLLEASYSVTLFEKNRGVGGRATTCKRDGFIYDAGAQYFKGGSPLSTEWITQRFPTPDLLNIDKPVWIFDGAGHIEEGDPKQNAEPRWSYRYGLISLSKQLADGLDIRLETPINRIEQTSEGWQLYDASNQSVGCYDQLLITLPAPQAVALIQVSQFNNNEQRDAICTQLGVSCYNPLLSIMLGYRPRPRPRPYYALVNTDKAHPISWLAWEHEKAPERVPEGAGLLIAQMAPQYSREHQETLPSELFQDVAERVSRLIDEPLSEPFFTDVQYWQDALPAEKADAEKLNALTRPMGLAFCGDAFVGGRVHLSLEHGIHIAQQLGNGERP